MKYEELEYDEFGDIKHYNYQSIDDFEKLSYDDLWSLQVEKERILQKDLIIIVHLLFFLLAIQFLI